MLLNNIIATCSLWALVAAIPVHQHLHHQRGTDSFVKVKQEVRTVAIRNPVAAPQYSAAASPSVVSSITTSATPIPSATQTAGGSASSGETHTGDITYYAVGLGACGVTSTEGQNVFAISETLYDDAQGSDANPNDNPLCGKTITISYGGTTAVATLVDRCTGCSTDSIDLSESLFDKFASSSVGRVSGVEWWFN